MKPTVRIHAVLGSARSLEPTIRPRNPGLHLPGGTTATRWLSQGASRSQGWPLAVEGALNEGAPWAKHCVLNLSHPGIGIEILTDELHPEYQNGLPWILAVMGDVTAQLSTLGARAIPGWVLLDLDGHPDTQRVRKIQSWCMRQGLDLALVGQSAAPPPHLTVLPYQPLSVVHDVSAFLCAMEHKL